MQATALALASLLGAWPAEGAPPLLLIVREQVRPGRLAAYDRNETELLRVCRRWRCPNAYIALTDVTSPRDVWWLTAWRSQAELDEAGRRYAGNRALAVRMGPLNARKAALASAPTTMLSKVAGGGALALTGVRFLVVRKLAGGAAPQGALYDLPGGERVAIRGFRVKPAAAPGATVLAIEPRWSLAPPDLVRADPAFWAGGRAMASPP